MKKASLCAGTVSVGHLPSLVGQRGSAAIARGLARLLVTSWRGRSDDLRDFWMSIALVCWCLWRYRNDIVFKGATPSSFAVVHMIRAEAEMWKATVLFRIELSLVDW
jgi:hypothetical protein